MIHPSIERSPRRHMALIGYDSQRVHVTVTVVTGLSQDTPPSYRQRVLQTEAALCGTRCSASVRARLSCGIAAAPPPDGWPSRLHALHVRLTVPYSQTKSWMRWPRSVRSVERLRDVRRLAWRARWRDRRVRSVHTAHMERERAARARARASAFFFAIRAAASLTLRHGDSALGEAAVHCGATSKVLHHRRSPHTQEWRLNDAVGPQCKRHA